MDIAWSSIILLLLLLPGLGAWIGYHTATRGTSRNNTPRIPQFKVGDTSVLSVAAVVGSAVLGHAVLLLLFARRIDFDLLLMALQVGKDDRAPGPLAANLTSSWGTMLGYFAASLATGVVLGFLLGLAARRLGGWLLQRSWMKNLLPRHDEVVEAQVELVVDDGCACRVIWIGRLVEYRTSRRGSIAELVLADARRHGPDGEETTVTRAEPVPGAARYTVIPGAKVLAMEMRRVPAGTAVRREGESDAEGGLATAT